MAIWEATRFNTRIVRSGYRGPPAVTTPVHVSPTFTTYQSQDPSSLESARSPVQAEGLLSEEDYLIPTVQEEEIAEGLTTLMSAGMSLQDPFESNLT